MSISRLIKTAFFTIPNEKLVKKRKWCEWYDQYDQRWLKFWFALSEYFLIFNITSPWLYFQLEPSAQIFKVLNSESILFTFSCMNYGEKTRNIFPIQLFICMSYIKCLSKYPYSKESVLPFAPITLILTIVAIAEFLHIYWFTEN